MDVGLHTQESLSPNSSLIASGSLAQYSANDKIQNLVAVPFDMSLSGLLQHQQKVKTNEKYAEKAKATHEKIVAAFNTVLLGSRRYLVNEEQHNMRCVQNNELLTIILYLPKQLKNAIEGQNEKNECCWVQYDKNDNNSLYIHCAKNGKVFGKYNILKKHHFQSIQRDIILAQKKRMNPHNQQQMNMEMDQWIILQNSNYIFIVLMIH